MQTSGGIFGSDDVASNVAASEDRMAISALISDAENHSSDPPEQAGALGLLARAAAEMGAPRPLQLPRMITPNPGDVLATLVRGPVARTMLEALCIEADAVNGVYVRFFVDGGDLFSLNPVRKIPGKNWRSVSIRGTRVRGVLSIWKNDHGRCMLAYQDPAAVIAWCDQYRGKVTREQWNKLMHTLNGNGSTNYYAPLVGLSSEEAIERAEEMQEKEDGFGDDAPTAMVMDDVDVSSMLKVIGEPFVKSFVKFNNKFSVAEAQNWCEMHALVDSSSEEDQPMNRGVKFAMKQGPGGEKVKKGQKKKRERSSAMKIRDACRLSKWLATLDPVVAEGWVRATRPDPAVVPRNTHYLTAYSERRSKHDYYDDLAASEGTHRNVDATTAMLPMMLKDSLQKDNDYLGPMSRKLIQSLLAIGNIEMHPGPSIPIAAIGNYNISDTIQNCYQASVNYIMTLDRPNLGLNVTSPFALDVNQLNPLVQPHIGVGPNTLGFCSDQGVGTHYYATIGFPDASYQGRFQYERVWVNGEWVVELTDEKGVHYVLTCPEITADMGLLAKITCKNADGLPDLGKPVVYIFDRRLRRNLVTPPFRLETVRALGMTYEAFVGPIHAKVMAVEAAELILCDRKVLNQILRTFARNVLSGTCTSNIQSLLAAGSIDLSGSEMAHLTNFAYYSTIRPAQISGITVSPYRDELLTRARSGNPGGSYFDHFFGRMPKEPDYRCVYGAIRPHWFVEFAGKTTFYLTLASAGGFLGYQLCKYTGQKAVDASSSALQMVSNIPTSVSMGIASPSSLFMPGTTINRKLLEVETQTARAVRVALGQDQTQFGSFVGGVRNFLYVIDTKLRWLWQSSGTSCSLIDHWAWQFCEELIFRLVPGARLAVACLEAPRKTMTEALLGFWSHYTFFAAGPLSLPAHLVSNVLVTKKRVFFFNAGMGMLSRYIKFYKTVPIAPEAELRVSEDLKHVRTKEARVFQIGPSILDMSSFAVNQGNKLLSCLGRVCKVTPQITNKPLFNEVASLMLEFGKDIRAAGGVEEVPWDEFIARFAPGKREVYEESRRKWEALGPDIFFGALKDKKEIVRNNFQKHELNALKLEDSDGVPASQPRTISPISYIVQGLLGGWMLGFGRKAKEVLSYKMYKGTKLIMVSGYTVEEMSELLLKELTPANDVVVTCGDDALFSMLSKIWYVDGKRWDAHYRNEYHWAKIRMYQEAGMSELNARIMYFFLKRVMTWKQGVGCTILRNVTSGDPDTTLGNGTTNGAVIICCKQGCRSWDEFSARTQSIGFTYVAAAAHMDLQPRGDFCSRVWVESHGPDGRPTSQLVLKPGKAFGKAGWTANGGMDLDELLDAKLLNLAMDLDKFPELSDIIRSARLRMKSRSVLKVMSEEWCHYIKTGGLTPVDGTRFFAERYGICYSDVIKETKLWFEALNGDNWEIDTPALRRVCEVDMEVTSFHGPLGDESLDLVPHQEYRSEARASRAEYIWLGIKLRANRLMHSLNGNISVQRLNTVVGGRGAQRLVCREIPRYHRVINAEEAAAATEEEGFTSAQQWEEETERERQRGLRHGRYGEGTRGGPRQQVGTEGPERNVRKTRGSHRAWFIAFYWVWGLCHERHCSSERYSKAGSLEPGGVQLRVCQGHPCTWDEQFHLVDFANQRLGDNVSLAADHRQVVHEIPFQATPFRVSHHEQRLFLQCGPRFRHFGTDLQHKQRRFLNEAANGGSHSRGVFQAEQFLRLRDRVRVGGQQRQMVQRANGEPGHHAFHGSSPLLLCSRRLSGSGGYGPWRTLGPLHCGTHRANFERGVDCIHHVLRRVPHSEPDRGHCRHEFRGLSNFRHQPELRSASASQQVRDPGERRQANRWVHSQHRFHEQHPVVLSAWHVLHPVDGRDGDGADCLHIGFLLHGVSGRGSAKHHSGGTARQFHGLRPQGLGTGMVRHNFDAQRLCEFCNISRNYWSDFDHSRELDFRVDASHQ